MLTCQGAIKAWQGLWLACQGAMLACQGAMLALILLTHSSSVGDRSTHRSHALSVLGLQFEVIGGARSQAVDAGAGSIPGHGHRGPFLAAGEAGRAAALHRVHH